jgi:hypothetical protein
MANMDSDIDEEVRGKNLTLLATSSAEAALAV